jgi:hypothetical protein
MRETRTYGSVQGALSNERPYRDLRRLLRLLTTAFGTKCECRLVSVTAASEGTADEQY